MISRQNTPEKFCIDKGTEYGETFKKSSKEKNIEIYSLMSEIKVAFAEWAIQSLKHLIYRYMVKNSFTSCRNLCLQWIVASIDLLEDQLEMSRILISSQFCTIKF